MAVLLTLALKDVRLLVRDKVGFFFAFFFPLIYAMFFGVLFTGASRGPSAIGLLVVDEDHTDGAARLIASLRSDRTLAVESAESRTVAAERVRQGARPAYLIIPAGFGAASERIFWGDPMRLEIGVDPGQSMTAGLIEGLVTARAYEQMQRIFTDREALRRNARAARESVAQAPDMGDLQRTVLENLLGNLESLADTDLLGAAAGESASQPVAGQAGWRPVQIETVKVTRATPHAAGLPRSSFAICFPQGMVWGVLACAATFAASLLVERTRGTLPRLLVAPLARWQILAGKALACFITTTGLMAALLLVARFACGVRPTSPLLLAVAVVCVAVAIVGLMMVLSVLGRTEAAVSGISWALIIVMAMLGGGMLPLAFMPPWLKGLSGVSLVKWAILALEGALWRGFSLGEMVGPCAVLVVFGVVGFAIGASVFRVTTAR